MYVLYILPVSRVQKGPAFLQGLKSPLVFAGLNLRFPNLLHPWSAVYALQMRQKICGMAGSIVDQNDLDCLAVFIVL